LKSEHLSYSPPAGALYDTSTKTFFRRASVNYSGIRERLQDLGLKVSLPMIIERAKALGCHRTRPKKKAHNREVMTIAVGAPIQHDASLHRWSPHAEAQLTLMDDAENDILGSYG